MHHVNPTLTTVTDAPADQRQHLDSPACTPRRLVSMPQLRINLMSPRSPSAFPVTPPQLLPPFSSPKRNGVRSKSRRISYTLKSRAAHYSFHLAVGSSLLAALFVLYMWSGSGRHLGLASSTGRFPLYSRITTRGTVQANQGANGVSFLTETEDELIAEDDLFADDFAETSVPVNDDRTSQREKAAQKAQIAMHREDVEAQRRMHSLMALVWWLGEGGGVIPEDWEVPSKQYLMKIGGRGMERLLNSFGPDEDGEDIFEDGWSEYAKKRYRITLFSKSYCPHSARAKGVFDEYRISPAPYVIELDYRPDYDSIQTLLKHLTGRRTVPNVLLDFTSVGGASELTLFHSEGGLQKQLDDMEVLPGARRKRAKAKAETERRAAAEVKKIAAAEAAVAAAEEEQLLLEVERQRVLAEEEAERVALIEADMADLVWIPGQDELPVEPRGEAYSEMDFDDEAVSDVTVDAAWEPEEGAVFTSTDEMEEALSSTTDTETTVDITTSGEDAVDVSSNLENAVDALAEVPELIPFDSQLDVVTELSSTPNAAIDLTAVGSTEPVLDEDAPSPFPQAVFIAPVFDEQDVPNALREPAQPVDLRQAIPRIPVNLVKAPPLEPVNNDRIPKVDTPPGHRLSLPDAQPDTLANANAEAKPPVQNVKAKLNAKARADKARNADRLGDRRGNRRAQQADKGAARRQDLQPGRGAPPRAAGQRMGNTRNGIAPNPRREAKNGAYALAEAAKAGRRRL